MDRITFVQYPGTTGQGGIYSGKVAPITSLANQLFDAIRADLPIGVEEAGDGRGSQADPNATTPPVDPATPVDPSASPDPSADPSTPAESPAVLPDKVVIPGVNGQTADQQTCTIGN